jgi:hypothetical protein
MAAGLLLKSVLLQDAQGTSPSIDDVVVPSGLAFLPGAWPGGGALTYNPREERLAEAGGYKARGFYDLFYERIHVVPIRLDVGNLLSAQVRPVEVWNAHFTPQLLSAITPASTEGSSLTGEAVPREFAALESLTYLLNISLTGPPSFSGSYTFEFPDEQPALLISGKRVVPFPFQHNWIEAVMESLSWRTGLIEPEDGGEQRWMLREWPRRTLTYKTLLAISNDVEVNARVRAMFDALMFGWMHRVWAVPVWVDAQRVQVPLDAGTQIIPVNTVGRDYDVGGFIMIWLNEFTYEAAEILEVADDEITTARGLQSAWPAFQTVVMPARLATLPDSTSLDGVAHDVESVSTEWLIQPEDVSTLRARAAGARTLYRGIDVLLTKNDYSSTIDRELIRPQAVVDYEVGRRFREDSWLALKQSNKWALLLNGHAQMADFFDWLNGRKGKLVPVWLPSWNRDFQILETVAALATGLVVTENFYSSMYALASTRRDVMIRLVNGTTFFRRITGSAQNLDGTETISIDSALGQIVNPADVDRISFLRFVRLESDQIEVAYESSEAARSVFKLVDLPASE